MKILILDPGVEERRRLEEVLQANAGADRYEITQAGGLEDALRLFQQRHPDLILIGTDDIEKVGRELCREVRATEGNRHTGIVFIDRRPSDDSTLSVQCLEMGADDFLRSEASPAELMARVKAVLRLKAMTDELRSANHRLRILSMTDELTGLANMRSFNQKFSDVVRRCRKSEAAVAVMMMDLDHFKSVNDTTNHLVGSYVIGEAGRILRQCEAFYPETDTAARYGGDEFIVVFETGSPEEARAKAEIVRQGIEAHVFEKDGCSIRITASIGVAWAGAGFDGRAEDIIKAADLMLYRSKNAGRNRVSCMILKYPVDLENVSRTHLVGDEDAGDELSKVR